MDCILGRGCALVRCRKHVSSLSRVLSSHLWLVSGAGAASPFLIYIGAFRPHHSKNQSCSSEHFAFIDSIATLEYVDSFEDGAACGTRLHLARVNIETMSLDTHNAPEPRMNIIAILVLMSM
jgi:hypothetical protein